MTGAGMMDCKSALTEADGDFEKAIEILRKKGLKASIKRADREAREGVVMALVSDDHKRGIIIKLSCETDFVARNDSFVDLATQFATRILAAFPADLDGALAIDFDGITIGDKVIEQVGVIGEKIELAAYERLEAPQVAPYIHMGYKAAVLVGLNLDNPDFYEAGRDAAMQVAALKAVAVDKDNIPQSVVDKEIEIRTEIAMNDPKNANKPKEILEKIVVGGLNKFYQEVTLLNQEFVKDSSKRVSEYLQGFDKALTVTDFKHVTLG